MRNFKILVLLAAIMTGFVSCDNDYLDLYPTDRFTKNQFWKSASDLELYCNQYYSGGSFYIHGGWSTSFYGENNSDNLVPEIPRTRLNGTGTLPTTGGGWGWGAIRNVNYFLSNYHTAEGVQADIDQYVGEAYFFKAYYYFTLLKSFGDLPWFNEVHGPRDEALYQPRMPRNQVTDSIVATMDRALALLKPKGEAPEFRINREIALLIKSRICLYEGTWEKYHSGTPFGVAGSDGSKFLRLAKEAAEELIDGQKYSLYNSGNPNQSYWKLFNQTDLSNNPEVMLWRKFDLAEGISHNLQRMLPWRGDGTGISLSLVESYLKKDGTLALDTDYSSLSAVAADRDPRLAQTILLPGDVLTNVGYETTVQRVFTTPYIDQSGTYRNTTGFMLYKGLDPDPAQQKNQEGIGITASVIFRYAEALLNYAEACAELGELTQAAADKSINKLRNRVGMAPLNVSNVPSDPNNTLGVSDLIYEVRRERRVELALENFRFEDLMRWRAHSTFAGKRFKGMKYYGSDLENSFTGFYPLVDENGFLDPYQESLPQGFGFDPNRDYLMPIPTQEITINPDLAQNPGWER
ncbi:RagB/SusD family nutrient uptake outer membrane protein [uncultured Sunxiuqinia sp.]|uniref:RagB/SusD family nutrient uptake outer membrane protein n=1 Tax=uncultured Sunxiuqinia sp. TaxID=1573825 RepID=UPI00263019BF|nr:RagB/SusD family nutrient uptake outer membrane protein [uncultured Sunxiuqinia sp.]